MGSFMVATPAASAVSTGEGFSSSWTSSFSHADIYVISRAILLICAAACDLREIIGIGTYMLPKIHPVPSAKGKYLRNGVVAFF